MPVPPCGRPLTSAVVTAARKLLIPGCSIDLIFLIAHAGLMEPECFTDIFSRRIAAFDKVAVVGMKMPVDLAILPENDEFAPRAAGPLRRRQQPLSGLRRG